MRAANDATTACIGAHGGADGGLVIAGTGSAAIVRVGGRETIIGGRGFAVGDDGSGSHIGLDALRAATRACDGLAPSSRADRGDLERVRRRHRRAGPLGAHREARRLRRLRAASVATCRAGDPIALAIVGAAAEAIAALVRRVAALGAGRMALVGGVGDALRPYLEAGIAALLTRPLHDATDGAILLAGGVVASERETAK